MAGCSNFYEPTPHLTHLEDESVLSNTASLTHTFIVDKKTSFVTCTQPQPDAAFSQGSSELFSLSFFSSGSDSQGGAELSEGVELAGRTPAVLMARELFFRMCEFSRNNELTKAEAKTLYVQTLAAVTKVWAVEAANTQIKIGEADTKAIDQSVTGLAPLATVNLPSSSSSTTEDALSSEESTEDSVSDTESDSDVN